MAALSKGRPLNPRLTPRSLCTLCMLLTPCLHAGGDAYRACAAAAGCQSAAWCGHCGHPAAAGCGAGWCVCKRISMRALICMLVCKCMDVCSAQGVTLAVTSLNGRIWCHQLQCLCTWHTYSLLSQSSRQCSSSHAGRCVYPIGCGQCKCASLHDNARG